MEIVDHSGLRQVKRSALASPVLTLLIPTWNNLDLLRLCVDSIRRHSTVSLQIVVHINEGADGTLEWIDGQKDIDYTFSRTNVGVCYALNYARTLASGEYLVFLNDDMYVCPGWDGSLMEEVKAIGHPWFFLSATMIEPRPSGNPCVIVADFGSAPSDFREAALLQQYAGLEKGDWMGATWPPNIVHKDVWDLVGGYSVEFSPGMVSDPDFSMKLWTLGVRLFKGVGRSRVYHFMSKSVGRVARNDGDRTFIDKWGVTSGYLTRTLLQRGKPYTGPALTIRPGAWQTAKMAWKRLGAVLRKP
jgi:glycosyltransferase involved in cell wall biosynthesis